MKRLFLRWYRNRTLQQTAQDETRLPDQVREWLQAIPKAEVHLHFEGSVSADTILQLARKYQIKEIRTLSDAKWALYFSNPQQFFQQFLYVSSLLRSPDDFYAAAADLAKRFRQENIRYAELTFAPHKFIRAGMHYPDLIDAIDNGLRDHHDADRFDHRFIIDIVRDLGPAAGMEMMKIVEKHPHPRVVAIGLGGGENYHAAQSVEVFRYAESFGLQKTAHAGEGRGPDSIWETLHSLKVNRLEHGVRAIEDPKLVDFLAERRIHLNLCLTSNVMLGVCNSLENHPIRRYHERGIPVNISTDDPAFFRTTLTHEYEKLVEYQKFTTEEIPTLLCNALEASFLPTEEKERLKREFLDEIDEIKAKMEFENDNG